MPHLLTLTLLFSLTLRTAAAEPKVTRIWDAAPHCAFTDLTRFAGKFVCTFRESSAHVHGTDGKIRVIASADGTTWESVALLEKPGVDLRDPKLSITPDHRLMLLVGCSFYEGKKLLKRLTHVAFSEDASTFSDLTPVEIDPKIATPDDWLWRVTWHGETAYGAVYQPAAVPTDPWSLHLVASEDGIRYRHVTKLEVPGSANETTLRFLPDGTALALVRREDGDGHLGTAPPPYTTWNWSGTGMRLGGPDFIRLPDTRLVAATRKYGSPTTTILGHLSPETGRIAEFLSLPSGGDTSYPGLLVHENTLWVSYYSSHEKNTAIYLAKIPLTSIPTSPETPPQKSPAR